MKQSVDRAVVGIDCQALTRIDLALRESRQIIDGKIRRIASRSNRNPHVWRAVKVVVGNINIVLRLRGRIVVHQQPRLIGTALPDLVGGLRHAILDEPLPG